MASQTKNARDIASLNNKVDSLSRKVIMQDIRIGGLLKKNEILEATLKTEGIDLVIPEPPKPKEEKEEGKIVIEDPVIEQPAQDKEENDSINEAGLYDHIDDISVLKSIADERGLKYHSQNGVKKLRLLLEEDDIATKIDPATDEGLANDEQNTAF